MRLFSLNNKTPISFFLQLGTILIINLLSYTCSLLISTIARELVRGIKIKKNFVILFFDFLKYRFSLGAILS